MKIYFITEGNKNIGFGHITRCVSLYQAFEEKGLSPCLMVNGDESIYNLLKDKKYEIFNWVKNPEDLVDKIKDCDIAIIDSYLATPEMYKKISDAF